MARGLVNLKKLITAKTEKIFLSKVKSFIRDLNINTMKIKSIMKLFLANRAVNDGNTNFPHFRTGNLAENLINIQVEKFDRKNINKTKDTLKYSVKVTSILDGGINNSNYSKATVKSPKGFAYANYLNYYNPKYKGYYDRLQDVFIDKLKEEISR
jgi:hypothetical protein